MAHEDDGDDEPRYWPRPTMPVRVSQTQGKGRGLFATRDIAKGEEIFGENPLVWGPSSSGDLSCVKCCRALRLKDGLPSSCLGCGFAVCGGSGNKCEASHVGYHDELELRGEEHEDETRAKSAAPGHAHEASGECAQFAALVSRDTKSGLKMGNSVSQWLTAYRALRLKRAAPRAYQRLLALEHHREDMRDGDLSQTYKQKVVPAIKALLGSEEDWSQEEILRCCGTLDSNAFKVDAGGGLRALYALASMINHDCAPNSRITFDSRRRLHLLAKGDIHKGEEITVTYCNPLLGTPARQEALRRNRFFLCTCMRCADPTEFGTHMSSLRCPRCKEGLLLLKMPVGARPSEGELYSAVAEAPSPCNKTERPDEKYSCSLCSFSSAKAKCDKFVESISKIHDRLLRPEVPEKNLRTSMEKETRVDKMEHLLEKHSALLPPLHYLMLNLKIELVNEYGLLPSKRVTLKSFERRLELLSERIHALRMVDGEESRLMGFLHFKHHNLILGHLLVAQTIVSVSEFECMTKRQGPMLKETAQEAARLLSRDAGCPQELKAIIDSEKL